MLARMGIGTPASGGDRPAVSGRPGRLPDDIDLTLEMLVGRMIGLLLIEISAFHGFAWAEAVLPTPTWWPARGRRPGSGHIRRRDAPRRLVPDGAHRDAGPDVGG